MEFWRRFWPRFRHHWSESVKTQLLIVFAAAAVTLYLQIRFGVIGGSTERTNSTTSLLPYLLIVFGFALYHTVATVVFIHAHDQTVLRNLQANLESQQNKIDDLQRDLMDLTEAAAAPGPAYGVSHWLLLAKEFSAIHEEMAWVMWTRCPPDADREWSIIGQSDKAVMALAERAGRMLLKSGLNGELPAPVVSTDNPVNRWFEFICSSEALRQDDEGHDDQTGGRVYYTNGRLLKSLQKCANMCATIGEKLT